MRALQNMFIASLLVASAAISYAGGTKEIRMSVTDTFRISETDKWNISVEKELPLRFADIKIKSKSGYPFSMMLYFKCDTPDLAKFNTPEKIARSIKSSSEQYLPYILEKKIELNKTPISYGYYTTLTDAELSKKSSIPTDEYKYMTRGMVRLSDDSVLGFSIMSNDINSDEYRKLTNYIYSFVKNQKKS